MLILAIETSCDETSASVTRNGREVLSNVVYSQIETHKNYGGVVPEIASRMHCEKLSSITQMALEEANIPISSINAIAVSYAPGLIGALLTGLSFAKGLSYSLGVPLIPVHHIRGHIASNYIAFPELSPPFICLVASGSHSHIVKVNDYTSFEILGATMDDAPGEAFDKIARILGLSYPGGQKIDALYDEDKSEIYKFPRVYFENNPYNFSFSGVKTNVINLVHKLSQKNEEIDTIAIASSFNKTVAQTLVDKLLLCSINNNMKAVAICGGVSANSYLRKYAKEQCEKHNIKLFIPPLSLCSDNAAMIGTCAYYEMISGNVADMSLNAYSNMPII